MIGRKIKDIQEHFAAVIGEKIIRYETAELLLEDGTWESWPDLPFRFYTGPDKLVAISWSRFDDLWLANDRSVPFPVGDSAVRWVTNGIEGLKPIVGASIESAMLGQGEMSIGGEAVEVWTRLLIRLDKGWLEVFNALDENGYAYHSEKPDGTFVPCIGSP